MKRRLSGSSAVVQEIVTNVLAPFLGENLMVVQSEATTDDDGVVTEAQIACTWDTDDLHELHVRMIETMIYHRQVEGLLEGLTIDICEDKVLEGSFHVISSDPAKANSIVDDVFKTAGVSDAKIFMCKQPIAQDMLNFSCYAVVAVGLSADEEKAINTSFSVKKFGAKVSRTVQTVGTAAHGSTKIVMKDIVAPTAEIAGKLSGVIVGGTFQAGSKGVLTFADELTGTININELKEYEPTQRLVGRVKSLFNKGKDPGAQSGSRVSKRF